MAGRRLVDAAKLFAAARSVGRKHVKLRSQQLDVYSRTSTLAKAVRKQSDRATLTAGAAIRIARRLNERNEQEAVTRSTTIDGGPTLASGEEPVPRPGTGVNNTGETRAREGIEQDHHYGRTEENASIQPEPEGEIQPKQDKPPRYPFPDGSIPPEHSPIRPGEVEQESFTTRPEPEVRKEPLAAEHEGEGEEVLQPVESGESTIPTPKDSVSRPSPERAVKLQRQSESQIPSEVSDTKPQEDAPETFHERPEHVGPTLSSLPRTKIPKRSEDSQGGVRDLKDTPVNADVFYSARDPDAKSAGPYPASDELPEDLAVNVSQIPTRPKSSSEPAHEAPSHPSDTRVEEAKKLARDVAEDVESSAASAQTAEIVDPHSAPESHSMRESRVPSSRIGRLWEYGGLATSMAFGAVGESFRRVTGGDNAGGSLMLSAGNLERLVTKLSRMRGAALKLGQMLSFQDLKMLPAPIHQVLQRVQDSADYMPASQRDRVLVSNLGAEWRDLFSSFQDIPFAAASIGQVHKAVLRSTGQEVAVKVQYPGVANSIDSDLNNISILLTASKLLPKGLFLEKTIDNARIELAWECDYVREAECGERFRSLLADEADVFTVPAVIHAASGREVLTTELMTGTAVTKLPHLTQPQRDWIGTQILRLCFREITEFRFMQTDPNWTNFLYRGAASGAGTLELLDFGASRDYPRAFIDPYVRTLAAAARGDRDGVAALSTQLGYLTGHESGRMREAHVASVLTLAEPFAAAAPAVYDFRDQTVTERVRSQIPLMLRERLAPPPEETYSLHRKLSGAFLLCARLGSRVRCREMFDAAVERFEKRAAEEGSE